MKWNSISCFPFDLWKQTAWESEKKKLILWNLKTFRRVPECFMKTLFPSCKPFGCPQRSWNSSQETGLSFLGNCNRATPIPEKNQIGVAVSIPTISTYFVAYRQHAPIDLWDVLKNTFDNLICRTIWANNITVIKYIILICYIRHCSGVELMSVGPKRLLLFGSSVLLFLSSLCFTFDLSTKDCKPFPRPEHHSVWCQSTQHVLICAEASTVRSFL